MPNDVHIDERSLKLFYGPLEAEIMRTMWQGHKTVRAIYRAMREEYTTVKTSEISYNSIGSTMLRMCNLGYIKKISGDKHSGFAYVPAHANEAAYVAHQLNLIFDALIESYPRETVTTFVKRLKSLQSGS